MANSDDKANWPFFMLGLGAAAVVGIFGLLWFLTKRVGELSRPQAALPHNPPANPWGLLGGGGGIHISGPVTLQMPGGQATQIAGPGPVQANTPYDGDKSTSMQTWLLDATSSKRLFTATRNTGWEIAVRVVGPPGSFAVFSTNKALIDRPGTPIGDSLIIPAGGTNKVLLSPRDVLYGKGSVADTTVTLTAAPSPDF